MVGGHGGGGQTGFRTWWQLNDCQNPENEHKYSFLGLQMWWQPENGWGGMVVAARWGFEYGGG